MEMQKYYSPQALERLRARQLSPEEQQRVEAAWQSLFAAVEAALDEDPAGDRGRELAARWRALIAAFTGGDGEIERGLAAFYADRETWSAETERRVPFKQSVWDWAARAMRSHSA